MLLSMPEVEFNVGLCCLVDRILPNINKIFYSTLFFFSINSDKISPFKVNILILRSFLTKHLNQPK